MTSRVLHHAAVLLAITAGLTACATTPVQTLAPARTSESPAAVDVTVAKRLLSVHFLPGSVTPSSGQIEAFNVLLGAGDVGQGDRILIQRPSGVLADTRARVLSAALAREGLRPVVAQADDVGESELRLVVEHAEATVRGCPNWSKPPGNDADNTLPSDFGCAAALDLAAMVADPRDLIEGRPLAPVVGDAAVLALHRYRMGAPAAPEATAPVVFADIDRQGRTTTAAAAGRAQETQAAQPAAAPGAPAGPANATARAAAQILGGGGQPQ